MQLAANMRSNANVQELVVEAVKTGDKAHIYHAAAMDPHTAAELSLAEIENLVDNMILAHRQFLAQIAMRAA